MDKISNYSVSNLDINPVQTSIDKKYNDAIAQICNFRENIPSELIKKKKEKALAQSKTQSQKDNILVKDTSVSRPGSKQSQ